MHTLGDVLQHKANLKPEVAGRCCGCQRLLGRDAGLDGRCGRCERLLALLVDLEDYEAAKVFLAEVNAGTVKR